MGNIYVTCARCNKGMTIAEYNCVFCSDIDNQLVCGDCFDKEQPKDLMKQITDLEAKLAESEKDREEFKKLAGGLREELIENDCMYKKEIDQLKQQLAEMTKKYELASLPMGGLVDTARNLEKQLAEKEKECAKHKEETVTFTPKLVNNAELVIKIIQSDADGIDYLKQSQNQTAIAELEKVKTLFKEEFKDKWVEDCGIDYCEWDNYDAAINIIDQQIRKLKN